MSPVIEIRTNHLHEGTEEHFHRAMHEQSLPLLRAAGTDVLAAMPSLEHAGDYMIVRAYASRAQRQASQDAFYGSDAWVKGPRQAIMACIDSYHTVVVAATPLLIASLREMGA